MRRFAFLQTVRIRLTLMNVVLLAVVLLFLGGILRGAMSLKMLNSIDNDLARRVRHHQEFWATVPGANHHHAKSNKSAAGSAASGVAQGSHNAANPMQVTAAAAQETKLASRWRAPVVERVFDLNGRQSWPPDASEPPWTSIAFVHALEGREETSIAFEGDERVRVLSAPLRRASGEIVGVVQVGASLVDVDSSLAHLNRTLLTMAPIALLVAGLGGMLLTGWMYRPLRHLNQAVALIGAEDLSRRLDVRGQDEFSVLAANFNAMLSRLEQSFEQQRRFTADASHELRTPLTVIKVYSSRGLADPESSPKQRQAWGATDRAATLMNAIVQDLLLLARSDAGQLTPPLEPTSLRAAMEAAIETVQAEESAPILNTIPHALLAKGDAILLTRVFTNLLKNAVRHTSREGSITAGVDVKAGALVVEITDTGTGIPPADLPHVLERFYRVDEARSRADGGTGLGLAICQSLVHAQGGHLEIDSVLGVGTTVRVSLCPAEMRPGLTLLTS